MRNVHELMLTQCYTHFFLKYNADVGRIRLQTRCQGESRNLYVVITPALNAFEFFPGIPTRLHDGCACTTRWKTHALDAPLQVPKFFGFSVDLGIGLSPMTMDHSVLQHLAVIAQARTHARREALLSQTHNKRNVMLWVSIVFLYVTTVVSGNPRKKARVGQRQRWVCCVCVCVCVCVLGGY